MTFLLSGGGWELMISFEMRRFDLAFEPRDDSFGCFDGASDGASNLGDDWDLSIGAELSACVYAFKNGTSNFFGKVTSVDCIESFVIELYCIHCRVFSICLVFCFECVRRVALVLS